MPQSDRIAQLFMVGAHVTDGTVDSGTKSVITESGVGSVLLLGNSSAGVEAIRELTDSLRDAGSQSERVDVLVAADQEGGQVQRLSGDGFDDIPSAVEQATMSSADLSAAAEAWGQDLKDAGVDYNLAPVVDVVPTDRTESNRPIGALDRGYGADPSVVREKAQAFIDGMSEASIATAVKHVPGLGRVTGNTDFTQDVVDDETTAESADIFLGYDNLDSIMVSSATYDLIDPDSPALYSSIVITDVLRDEFGFEGVVVSDDVGGAESAASVATAERGVTFLAAGGDLVINANPNSLAEMIDAVTERVEGDAEFADEILAKATRVIELKASVGRADCTPGD